MLECSHTIQARCSEESKKWFDLALNRFSRLNLKGFPTEAIRGHRKRDARACYRGSGRIGHGYGERRGKHLVQRRALAVAGRLGNSSRFASARRHQVAELLRDRTAVSCQKIGARGSDHGL